MQKHDFNSHWIGENLLLLLLTYNIIRDENPWFSKCGSKVNLLRGNHVVIKKVKEFTVLKH